MRQARLLEKAGSLERASRYAQGLQAWWVEATVRHIRRV
ncbi:MAG: hypothetical protein BSOLF_1264 [Candidatus Carbobacillus altaicus]|uniref:Uncharacterized protein n=1 Tax=Candidatus Carbonibacillus altaicus TaxID=2163959 RepID=A0A2R6Y4E7_9BACL|nr:MAG: hypothetical protein BSOLF_1264 [Candidatus Carbobacillus altaicus]